MRLALIFLLFCIPCTAQIINSDLMIAGDRQINLQGYSTPCFYTLDGVDEYIGLGDILDTELSGATPTFTFSVTFKNNNTENAAVKTIASKWTGASSGRAWFLSIATDRTIHFRTSQNGAGSTGIEVRTTRPLATSLIDWYTIDVTYDGSLTPNTTVVSIFINGEEVSLTSVTTGSFNIANTTAPIRIGSIFDAAGAADLFWDGSVNQFNVWDGVLTDAQILEKYRDGKPKNPLAYPGLIGSWQFDSDTWGGSSYTVRDASEGHNNGTTTNMEEADLMCDIDESPYHTFEYFNIAVGSCPHAEEDVTHSGFQSISNWLSESIRLVDPKLWIINGDFFANDVPVTLAGDSVAGAEIASQMNSQGDYVTNRLYVGRGNHDAGDYNYIGYERYVDSYGVNTAYSGRDSTQFYYKIIEDNSVSLRYAFRVGNMTFIILGDVNDIVGPTGRSGETGGRPSGALLTEDEVWWESFVASEYAAGQNVITCTHQALVQSTTIGTGPDPEGSQFHGPDSNLDFLATVGYLINDRDTNDTTNYQSAFMDYMASNPGENLACFYGHTHYDVGETYAGRSWTHTENGCLFVSGSAITSFWAAADESQWFVLSLRPGSTTAKIYKIHSTNADGFGFGNNSHIFDSDYVLTLTLNEAFVAP